MGLKMAKCVTFKNSNLMIIKTNFLSSLLFKYKFTFISVLLCEITHIRIISLNYSVYALQCVDSQLFYFVLNESISNLTSLISKIKKFHSRLKFIGWFKTSFRPFLSIFDTFNRPSGHLRDILGHFYRFLYFY